MWSSRKTDTPAAADEGGSAVVVMGVVLPLAEGAAAVLLGHPGAPFRDPGICLLPFASSPVATNAYVGRLDMSLDRQTATLDSGCERVAVVLRPIREVLGGQVADWAAPIRAELESSCEEPVEVRI
jgi:hypothetical protein